MHTPTKAQMQVVIDNFKKVLPMAVLPNHLRMCSAKVNTNGHKCGTLHCFGGWYAVAVCDLNTPLYFTDGKVEMTKDLGLEQYFNHSANNNVVSSANDNAVLWANDNAVLWGNDNGINMFSDQDAFYHPVKRPNGAENLQHIIDHLEEVRDRLPA